MNDVTLRANEPGSCPILSGASFFPFFKIIDFVGATHHLNLKKALFLQLCTTLLTSIFGGAIMALESS